MSPVGSEDESQLSSGCGRRSTAATWRRFSTSASRTPSTSARSPGVAAGTTPANWTTSSLATRFGRGVPPEAVAHCHASPQTMRALGFCVSVAHANYMASEFSKHGFESEAITGETPEPDRQRALQRLRLGQLHCIFSVDVLGEGVDVPNVDTVILLRPTQSATVFSQQIGRGLRLSEDKAGLTIIDLIGQQHRRFRFEDRLRALVDETNGSIRAPGGEGLPVPALRLLDDARRAEPRNRAREPPSRGHGHAMANARRGTQRTRRRRPRHLGAADGSAHQRAVPPARQELDEASSRCRSSDRRVPATERAPSFGLSGGWITSTIPSEPGSTSTC